MKKWIAKKRPKLKPEHAKKRLDWARARRNWSIEDWQKYCWSDECKVERSKDPRTVWVFASNKERFLPECVNPELKGPDTWLIVWACFYWDQKGTFAPIILNINQHIYKLVLEYCLLPVMQRMQEVYEEVVFVQDNARPHTAQSVIKWLEDHNINVEDWPPYSPDLNPIEQVWKRLKELLQKHHPYIVNMPGGPDAIRAKLIEVLPEMWDLVPQELLRKLVESMPRRVKAVIAAKGWYTKY